MKNSKSKNKSQEDEEEDCEKAADHTSENEASQNNSVTTPNKKSDQLQNLSPLLKTPKRKTPSSLLKKSRNKSFKKRKLLKQSPLSLELNAPTKQSLSAAEALRMVIIEDKGQQFKLNIDQNIPIQWIDEDTKKEEEDTPQKEEKPTPAAEKPQENQNKTPFWSRKGPKKKWTQRKMKTSLHNTPKQSPSNYQTQQAAKPLPSVQFRVLSEEEWPMKEMAPRPSTYYRYIEQTDDDMKQMQEYDLDEQDMAWLELTNQDRKNKFSLPDIEPDELEFLIDRIEKESYFEQSKMSNSQNNYQAMVDDDAVCCVCNDGECENTNQILFCDLCNIPVHQDCYGVPYIPEGEWLCKRCTLSPSVAVSCVLCPNKNGAFKMTDDGRWAHVVCGLWIPECGFSNTVFLEPIDQLKNIPQDRFKFKCYICKQKRAGACIQCSKKNCYEAFHVTCAQEAGLFMRMEGKVMDNGTPYVQHTAYCDAHTPRDHEHIPKSNFKKKGVNIEEKLSLARQAIQARKHETPSISIPSISKEKMAKIASQVHMGQKKHFMKRLLSYWCMKRQGRNGVPLLRRLQSNVSKKTREQPDVGGETQDKRLRDWARIRHDLEKGRLLSELVINREKLKLKCINNEQKILELELNPLNWFMRKCMEKMISYDTHTIFLHPVKKEDAPQYYTLVKRPMDFSRIVENINKIHYRTLESFEADLNLVFENCMFYNSKTSIYFLSAKTLKDKCGALIRATRRDIHRRGLCAKTGVKEPVAMGDMNEDQREYERLQELCDTALIYGKKTKKYRDELKKLKRRLVMKRNQSIMTSPDHNTDDVTEEDLESTADEKPVNEEEASNKAQVKKNSMLTPRKRARSSRISSSEFFTPETYTNKRRKLKASNTETKKKEEIQPQAGAQERGGASPGSRRRKGSWRDDSEMFGG